MKFLTKINRNYLVLFSVILIVFSISGYYVLKTILIANTRENLFSLEVLIEKQLAENNQIPSLKPIIEVVKVNNQSVNHPEFKEKIKYNSHENEQESFIEYSNVIKVNGAYYSVKLREASVESEDLAASIAAVIFSLLLAAFAISYYITKRLNKTTWNVFENNLKEIENFDFRRNTGLQLQTSGIEEFDRLNMVVNNLTAKLKKDFISLKEFTENASHEIQTPLAIASLNLEEILQQELTEEPFSKVVTAIHALKRLSLLNQNLLLLAKIENNQFTTSEFIILNDLVKRKIDEFEPIFNEKNIKVSFTSQSDFKVKMNVQLADILINNLFSNAVNHNIENGLIEISIKEDAFRICNTGMPNQLDNEDIFQRFIKGNSKSHGLGLAIVKQICSTHFLEIKYVKNELHCFTISQKT